MSTRYFVRFGNDYAAAGSFAGTLVRFPQLGDINSEYPRTVGPLTLGRTTTGSGNNPSYVASAGWTTGDDELLRGRARRGNSLEPVAIRIDLPDGPGSYRVGAGVTAASFSNGRWRFRDGVGGATRIDASYVGATIFGDRDDPAPDQWAVLVSTSGFANAGPIDADAFDPPQAGVEIDLSSGVLELLIGGGAEFNSDISFLWFEKVVAGPTVTAVTPTSGRATGTVVDITVNDSTGATGAAINGVPLTGFTIVNATTVRGTTAGATTGAVSVTNADGTGTGPTFTVVPVANAFRLVGAAPWAPAAGPVLGVPYSLTVEAFNTTANARDTLFADPVALTPQMVSGDPAVITSGAGPVTFAAGAGTFSNVVFGVSGAVLSFLSRAQRLAGMFP